MFFELSVFLSLKDFLSACDDGHVDSTETEYKGLGFWVCKLSSMNSVSGLVNRVHRTRFVSLETESNELGF